jgi:hypothetical protein
LGFWINAKIENGLKPVPKDHKITAACPLLPRPWRGFASWLFLFFMAADCRCLPVVGVFQDAVGKQPDQDGRAIFKMAHLPLGQVLDLCFVAGVAYRAARDRWFSRGKLGDAIS